MTCKVTGSTNDIKPQLFLHAWNFWNDWNHWNERPPRFKVFQLFKFALCLLRLFDSNVSIIVDCSFLLGMNHSRCIQLLDDRGSGNLMTWFQTLPRVYLAVEHAMLLTEIDFSRTGLGVPNAPSRRLRRRKLCLRHEPVGNQPETYQLHRLGFCFMSGSLFMLCVEALPHEV